MTRIGACSVGGVLVSALWVAAPASGQAPACDAACQARAAELEQEARALDSQGQSAAAADRFGEVVRIAPGTLRAEVNAIRAGRCLEDLQRFTDAAGSYGQAVAIGNSLVASADGAEAQQAASYRYDAMLRRARAYTRANSSEQAVGAYDDLIALSPTLAGRLGETFKAGRLLAEDWHFAEAIHFYDRAIADLKDHAVEFQQAGLVLGEYIFQAHRRRAYACFFAGRLDEGSQTYLALIAGDPLSVRSQQMALELARAFKRAKRNAEALTIYQKAITIADAAGDAGTPAEVKDRRSFKQTGLLETALLHQSLGDCASAAQACTALIEQQRPLPAGTQEHILNVASCLADERRFESALYLYDSVLGASDAERGGALRRKALLGKASACLRAGLAEKGLQVTAQIKSENPTSGVFADAVSLEAQFGQITPAEAAALAERQDAASQIFRQARQARMDGENERVMPLLDEVIDSYPDTPAAVLALTRKAVALQGAGKADEAFQAYSELLKRPGIAQSNAEIIRLARLNQAELYANILVRDRLASKRVKDEQWDDLRRMCEEVMKTATPGNRARAYVKIAASYHWQHRFAESLVACEQLLAEYEHLAGREELATPVLQGWAFSGIALMRLNRPQEAWIRFQQVLEAAQSDCVEHEVCDELVPPAYYDLIQLSRPLGISESERASYWTALLRQYPDSPYSSMLSQLDQ